jgi:hypothetical protein
MSTTVAGKPGEDPTLPDVTLILGGVERKLCYDYNAIVLAEKMTGVNLLEGVVGQMTATNLRGLLWASLKRESPDLTIDQVGALIQPRALGIIQQALMAVWFGSIAEPDEKDETPGEAEAQAAETASA